jgi:hypothetical protein
MGLKDVRNLQQEGAAGPDHGRGAFGSFRGIDDGVAQATEMMSSLAGQQQLAQRLLSVGLPGTATITAVADTGATINDNPSVLFDLQVLVDGGDAYPVEHTQVVSRMALPGFQPGATVPVRVDPEDPNVLIIA